MFRALQEANIAASAANAGAAAEDEDDELEDGEDGDVLGIRDEEADDGDADDEDEADDEEGEAEEAGGADAAVDAALWATVDDGRMSGPSPMVLQPSDGEDLTARQVSGLRRSYVAAIEGRPSTLADGVRIPVSIRDSALDGHAERAAQMSAWVVATTPCRHHITTKSAHCRQQQQQQQQQYQRQQRHCCRGAAIQ